MKNKQNRQKKQYVKKISRLIPNDCPDKQRLLESITQNLDAFLAEHGDCSAADIADAFGCPSEVAASFMAGLPSSDIAFLLKKKKRDNRLLLSVCILTVMIALLLCGAMYRFWRSHQTVPIGRTTYYYNGREVSYEEFMDLQTESNTP